MWQQLSRLVRPDSQSEFRIHLVIHHDGVRSRDIVEKNGKLNGYIAAALAAMVVNYVLGTNWMYFAYEFWAAAPDAFTYKVAWMWMIPPLPKDILLAVLAGIFGHRMYKILKVRHGQ